MRERPPCMTEEEGRLWFEANMTLLKGTRARWPCEDCTPEYWKEQMEQDGCLRKEKDADEVVLEP